MEFRTAAELALLIREERRRLGWSQQKLADLTGAGRDWIVQLERGKPSVELTLVLRTLKALGLVLEIHKQIPVYGRPEIDLDDLLENPPGKKSK